MVNRIDKVNSLLEHEINRILLHDFNFSPDVLVTLTRVEATANLIEAKVFISVLPDIKADQTIATLKSNIRDIQQKINKTLNMRPVPRIMFIKDKVIKEAGKIEELLAQLKKDEK